VHRHPADLTLLIAHQIPAVQFCENRKRLRQFGVEFIGIVTALGVSLRRARFKLNVLDRRPAFIAVFCCDSNPTLKLCVLFTELQRFAWLEGDGIGVVGNVLFNDGDFHGDVLGVFLCKAVGGGEKRPFSSI
jgi:hypothetical protein